MGSLTALSVLILRQAALALPAGEAAGKAVDLLVERFTDHSQRLTKALQQANDRAWKSLEIALAGESFLSRLSRSEDKAFRQQVRAFLDAAPLPDLAGKTSFRDQCVRQLRQARKAGLLNGGATDPKALAREAGALARFGEPLALLELEWQQLAQLADALVEEGYKALGDLLRMRPAQGRSLLVIAVRYFFRRTVERDEQLARGLSFALLERLQASQEQAFAGLHQALSEQGQRLEQLLGDLQDAVAEAHAAVLDVQQEQQRLGGQAQDIYQEVIRLKEKLDLLHHEVRPRNSLSIRSEAERQLVRQVVEHYRSLPEDRRQRMPALLNAIGQLEVAAGDFPAAERDFKGVTGLVTDPQARGEAYLNAYRAALEQQRQDEALKELIEAIKLDSKRFAPFPVGKYKPKRILGAGGFGVAFLCKHKDLNADVVVKTLHGDDLDRSMDDVLAEARLLYQLDHPCIIRLLDCGYTLPASKARPYFVMAYFPGMTLEEQVREGPLAVEDGLAVARLMAEGLQAAHARGILHRDVKPANVLVRKDASGWQVKLIDFGLALRTETLQQTTQAASTQQHSIVGSSIAGTVDYAAPEQMGKLPGVPVGPYSDVYGWARTCCYALFGTSQPLRKHWSSIPSGFADLLEQCLEEDSAARPANAAALVEALEAPGKQEWEGKKTPTRKASAATRPTPNPVSMADASERLHRVRLVNLLRELLQAQKDMARAQRKGLASCLGLVLALPGVMLLPGSIMLMMESRSRSLPVEGLLLLVAGLGLSIAPLIVLLGRKQRQLVMAKADTEQKTLEILREYPEAVKAWGGKAVLDNVASVQELIRSLEAS